MIKIILRQLFFSVLCGLLASVFFVVADWWALNLYGQSVDFPVESFLLTTLKVMICYLAINILCPLTYKFLEWTYSEDSEKDNDIINDDDNSNDESNNI